MIFFFTMTGLVESHVSVVVLTLKGEGVIVIFRIFNSILFFVNRISLYFSNIL